MRRIFFFLFLFLAGCHIERVEKVVMSDHPVFFSEIESKIPVYWQVELEDDWNRQKHVIVMNEFGYLETGELDDEALRTLARELASSIDTPMVPAKRGEDGRLLPGSPRVILNEAAFIEKLKNLPPGTETMKLPIETTEPNVEEADLAHIDERIIGSFTTTFNPSVTGRAHNIYLSAREINNVVLGPGDTFSFNAVVGERTKERGYQEALEIVNQQFVVGIGGGICQTSSTLFNAVDEAGLEIIERYTHSRDVGYVAKGRDATVSWGGPDFRFKNPHSYPVLIRANVDKVNGEITVTVHTYEN